MAILNDFDFFRLIVRPDFHKRLRY